MVKKSFAKGAMAQSPPKYATDTSLSAMILSPFIVRDIIRFTDFNFAKAVIL